MLIPKPLKGESRQAFRAFKTYIEMGEDRSYRKVAHRLGCSETNIEKFAARWEWQKRLHLLMAEEAERDAAAEKQARLEFARKREAMRLNHESRMLRLADGIYERLEQFQKLPIVKSSKTEEIKDAKGNTIAQTIIVEPSGMNWSSFARAFAELDTRVRLALGMATTKAELTGKDGAPLLAGSNAPIVNVSIVRDETSEKVRQIQKEFLEQHPEHPQAQRFLREFNGERDTGNGGK